MADKKKSSDKNGIDGLLGGVTDFLEKLGDLAEKGEALSRTGEFTIDKEKDLKGMYGFSFKVGLGGDEVKVEPFGNVHTDEDTGEAVVQEVREPPVDIFNEEKHILIVAEMPGVEAEDIQCELEDDILTISATQGDKKYRKEVLLPESCKAEGIAVSCKNGIAEISCPK